MPDLRAELFEAAQIADLVDRSLAVLSIVSDALAPLHVHPVLVGGMAVCFWTSAEAFVTKDIDIVMDEPAAADAVLDNLGFEGSGRHWRLPGTEVFLEAPSRTLPAGAVVREVRMPNGRIARILSLVDVLLVRLEEFAAGGHQDVGLQSLALIRLVPAVDSSRLNDQAARRGVDQVLHRLTKVADEMATGGRVAPDMPEFHQLALGN